MAAAPPKITAAAPTQKSVADANLATIVKPLGPRRGVRVDAKSDLGVTKIDLNGDKRAD